MKVYNIIFEEGKTAIGKREWCKNTMDRFNETGINLTTNIFNKLINNHWNVLDTKQKKYLEKLSKEVGSRACSKNGKLRAKNGTLGWNTPEAKKKAGESHKRKWREDTAFVEKEIKRRKEFGSKESFRENCRIAKIKSYKEMSEEQRQLRNEAIRKGIKKREQRRKEAV